MTRSEIAAKLLPAMIATFWSSRAELWRRYHRHLGMAQQDLDELQRRKLDPDPDPDRREAQFEILRRSAKQQDEFAEEYRKAAVDMIRPIVEAEHALHGVDPDL